MKEMVCIFISLKWRYTCKFGMKENNFLGFFIVSNINASRYDTLFSFILFLCLK